MPAVIKNLPRHSRDLVPVNRILKRLVQRRILGHPFVGIVFTVKHWPIGTIRLGIVFIRQDVLRRVPPAKAEIEAAHKGNRLVNDAELFVLCVSFYSKDDGIRFVAEQA